MISKSPFFYLGRSLAAFNGCCCSWTVFLYPTTILLLFKSSFSSSSGSSSYPGDSLSQTRCHLGVGCYHRLPAWRVQGDSGMGHLHRPRCLRSLPRISRSHLRRPPRHPRPCLRCWLCRTLSIVGGAAAEISRPNLPRRRRWGGFVNGSALGSCPVGSRHRVSV